LEPTAQVCALSEGGGTWPGGTIMHGRRNSPSGRRLRA